MVDTVDIKVLWSMATSAIDVQYKNFTKRKVLFNINTVRPQSEELLQIFF